MSCLVTGDLGERPSRGLNDLDSDDDEMDVCQNKKSYEVQASAKLGDVEVVVLTDTKISRDFIQVYLDVSKQVGQIIETTEALPDENEEATRSVKTIAKLSQITPQLCHCHFSSLPASNHVNEVAEKLLINFANPKISVVLLTSKSVTEYQCADDNDAPEVVTKWLKTSKWPVAGSLKPDERLQLPNIVGGVSAALLTQAEFTAKPGCMLVSYTDVDSSDSLTLGGFLDTFFKLGPVKALALAPVSAKVSASRLKTIFEKQERGQIFM